MQSIATYNNFQPEVAGCRQVLFATLAFLWAFALKLYREDREEMPQRTLRKPQEAPVDEAFNSEGFLQSCSRRQVADAGTFFFATLALKAFTAKIAEK